MGYWFYSKEFENYNEEAKVNYNGYYFIYDYQLSPKFHPFIRYGSTVKNIPEISSNLVIGFTSASYFQKKDKFGALISLARLSEVHQKSDSKYTDQEISFELSYNFDYQNFNFTPHFMLIKNPSGNSEIKDAYLLGLRSIYTF